MCLQPSQDPEALKLLVSLTFCMFASEITSFRFPPAFKYPALPQNGPPRADTSSQPARSRWEANTSLHFFH